MPDFTCRRVMKAAPTACYDTNSLSMVSERNRPIKRQGIDISMGYIFVCRGTQICRVLGHLDHRFVCSEDIAVARRVWVKPYFPPFLLSKWAAHSQCKNFLEPIFAPCCIICRGLKIPIYVRLARMEHRTSEVILKACLGLNRPWPLYLEESLFENHRMERF